MKEHVLQYIESNFPDLSSDLYLRFELGDPYGNGTDERINQVVTRVNTLFEEFFKLDDSVYLYIKDWGESEDVMFGNTTPAYLYELLSHQKIEEKTMYDIEEDVDEVTGKPIEIRNEYNVKFVCSEVRSVGYKEILEGIGNYEQGRDPSIGQSVYFINMEKNLIFHMYDDRGCDVFSLTKEPLLPIYETYSKWILDYNRVEIDNALEVGLFNIHETAAETAKRLKINNLKVEETKINLYENNTCHITHSLAIPNGYAEECIHELSGTGFTIAGGGSDNACTTIQAMKTEALALIDYQTELMSLYAKKYKGEYHGWSAKRATSQDALSIKKE
ncbi:DUF3885 domain-containing protein [Sporosarcina aquimarina]|uniref:DUF3885 domain-containing protein n=1 Tax=Sporosarcina aquimarina TaxID=114975 RepID=A0ABU4G1V5_9BACL|nr:DUF3885 domain-containing protein [Sporosarcina aquimarina]MDW0110952.1 DUF3885 domain-containing protein [Sporosarcina aquimarina]